jgi:ubiquinone/menaquinone biosynthesis C-methylase UbiE
VNYDQTNIPAVYDEARDLTPEMLQHWMHALKTHLHDQDVQRILDLGCGTGRFSNALALSFAAEVVGIDPSMKMLERARQKQADTRLRYEQGSAEAIPLPSAFVDLVFMSMSFHHFDNPALAVEECHRVLRTSGSAIVRTGSREHLHDYPYVRFFPSTPALIEETLLSAADLRAVFEQAGFRTVASDVIMQTIAPNWSVYADRLALGGDSILARLDSNEFAEGLAAIRRHAASVGDERITEPIDLFVFRR